MPRHFRKELELEELPAPEVQFWESYWINLMAVGICWSGGFLAVGGAGVGRTSGAGLRGGGKGAARNRAHLLLQHAERFQGRRMESYVL